MTQAPTEPTRPTPTSSHPSALDLEAFAAGEDSPRVVAHVEGCDACRGFVARAKTLTMRTPMDRALGEARRHETRRRFTLLASAGVPLAAAAAAVLFLRAPLTTTTATTPGSASVAPVALAENDPDTTFKGGVQLAVVRDRTGAQDRFVGTVRVRPGDRLRVEVALDRSQAILAGVLGDDGSWVELMPEAIRDAGTHFSEKSVRIDEHRANGTILVGAPADVKRARDGKQPNGKQPNGKRADGVRTLSVEWEAP